MSSSRSLVDTPDELLGFRSNMDSETTPLPFCFVLMPFGDKPDPTGGPPIPFDRIYETAIKPAIEDAGLVPIRADEERVAGIIHKAMFERLLLCEYAVADLTTANPNVFYELGVRHAARRRTTQAIYSSRQSIPFDLNFLRAMPYAMGEGNCFGEAEASLLRKALSERLKELRIQTKTSPVDSPLFQLLGDWNPGDIARLKADVFRERTATGYALKERMANARRGGDGALEQLQSVEASLGTLDLEEAGVIVDLLLSYRAIRAWSAMINLFEKMPGELRRQPMIREQLAFALNRRAGKDPNSKDRERARVLLQEVIAEYGPTSESCGLLGRLFKDLWDAHRAQSPRSAIGYLRQAIDSYRLGFESDSRDGYPGINAVVLLDILGTDTAKKDRDALLPVVKYAVERRLASKKPDYWDHAARLELAVVGEDQETAEQFAATALANMREKWEPETTARTLSLISEHRRARGQTTEWLDAIIEDFKIAASG